LRLEARLTSRRLNDAPRTSGQLEQLMRKVQRGTERLPGDQAELLEIFMASLGNWTGFAEEGGVTNTTVRRLLEAAAGTQALVWDENLGPELAARFWVPPRRPPRLGG